MKTRTWPYGTTRKGTLENIVRGRDGTAHVVLDDHNEGHVLVAGAQDKSAKEGDTGTLTFTKGGPTGGYWKFKKDSK